MKLIICLHCDDVIKLVPNVQRICLCGQSGGIIFQDGLNGEFWGEEAVPIGFANGSLLTAIRAQPQKGLGKPFNAFVIPKVCPTLKKVQKP